MPQDNVKIALLGIPIRLGLPSQFPGLFPMPSLCLTLSLGQKSCQLPCQAPQVGYMEQMCIRDRAYSISRKTRETQVGVNLCLEGGEIEVSTGIGFFDHMLTALAFYAGFGLKLEARGDLEVDGHHTVEDVGLSLIHI